MQYTTMGYSTVVNSNIAARLAQEGPLDWHDFLQAQLAGDPEPAEGPTEAAAADDAILWALVRYFDRFSSIKFDSF